MPLPFTISEVKCVFYLCIIYQLINQFNPFLVFLLLSYLLIFYLSKYIVASIKYKYLFMIKYIIEINKEKYTKLICSKLL